MSGNRALKAGSRSVTSVSPQKETPTQRNPSFFSAAMLAAAAFWTSTTARAAWRYTCPASVGTRPVFSRKNRGVPSSLSSFRRYWLRVDWVTNSFSAAWVTLCCRAISRIYSGFLMSILFCSFPQKTSIGFVNYHNRFYRFDFPGASHYDKCTAREQPRKEAADVNSELKELYHDEKRSFSGLCL
ncbi:unknown [Oscillibacter sp. CAG:155]|nr:unknown [Oscillibacter sp. CAG:155]